MEGSVALAKKRKVEEMPRTAADARKTVRTTVASPYNHGIDRPERVMDTVDVMHKRRQITAEQKRAAEIYRDAFDECTASMGGVMDFDKVRGAGTPGAPLGPRSMEAAETLRQAREQLGQFSRDVVEFVVGRGYSIEETAKRVSPTGKDIFFFKKTVSDREVEAMGKRFRDALTELANLWFPKNQSSKIRSHIADGAKPGAGLAGSWGSPGVDSHGAPMGKPVHREVGVRSAHANSHGVRFSDEKDRK